MGFRDLLDVAKSVQGERPLWPSVLGSLLDSEFKSQRAIDAAYKGDIVINRFQYVRPRDVGEVSLVAMLFESATRERGVVQVEGENVWLLGFQWPTQGGRQEVGRKADLVGITQSGSLVVFEAKATNGEPPLTAVLQGLDYLACFLRPTNFAKIQSGFQLLRSNLPYEIPVEFGATVPSCTERPKLVVLAPEEYYSGLYSRSIRGREWPWLADVGETFIPSVEVLFCHTDFKSLSIKRASVSS